MSANVLIQPYLLFHQNLMYREKNPRSSCGRELSFLSESAVKIDYLRIFYITLSIFSAQRWKQRSALLQEAFLSNLLYVALNSEM
jgi:hypothetical protein